MIPFCCTLSDPQSARLGERHYTLWRAAKARTPIFPKIDMRYAHNNILPGWHQRSCSVRALSTNWPNLHRDCDLTKHVHWRNP